MPLGAAAWVTVPDPPAAAWVRRRPFAALAGRNYRLYFGGQVISQAGSMMQVLAQAWLVLSLTGSSVALGAITAAQFLPMLVGGPYAGVWTDRLDKRRLLLCTQTASLLLSTLIAALTASGRITLVWVFVVALSFGVVGALESPARHVFAFDLVGRELVSNAVSLNEVIVNASRVLGPALAGVVISNWGITYCFVLNAFSCLPAIAAIWLIRGVPDHRISRAAPAAGQLREGVAHAASTPVVRALILAAAASAILFNSNVALPLMAYSGLDVGAAGYAAMASAFGAGALVGAFVAASDGRPSPRRARLLGTLTGAVVVVSALMPDLASEVVAQVVTGFVSIWFIAIASSTVQLWTPPVMRGRVMGLWATALPGSSPIGGLLVGLIGQAGGARAALASGGVALLLTMLAGWTSLRSRTAGPPVE
jgi:MFS family permease